MLFHGILMGSIINGGWVKSHGAPLGTTVYYVVCQFDGSYACIHMYSMCIIYIYNIYTYTYTLRIVGFNGD